MNETCDCCGKQTPVFGIVFNGRQYFCWDCVQQKAPTAMGLTGRQV